MACDEEREKMSGQVVGTTDRNADQLDPNHLISQPPTVSQSKYQLVDQYHGPIGIIRKLTRCRLKAHPGSTELESQFHQDPLVIYTRRGAHEPQL